MRGDAALGPYDPERAGRLFEKYLGPDDSAWPNGSAGSVRRTTDSSDSTPRRSSPVTSRIRLPPGWATEYRSCRRSLTASSAAFVQCGVGSGPTPILLTAAAVSTGMVSRRTLIGSAGTLFAGATGGCIGSGGPSNDRVRWQERVRGHPVLAGETVDALDDWTVHALSANDGSNRWTVEYDDSEFDEPLCLRQHLAADGRHLYLPGCDGIRALERSDGSQSRAVGAPIRHGRGSSLRERRGPAGHRRRDRLGRVAGLRRRRSARGAGSDARGGRVREPAGRRDRGVRPRRRPPLDPSDRYRDPEPDNRRRDRLGRDGAGSRQGGPAAGARPGGRQRTLGGRYADAEARHPASRRTRCRVPRL